MAMFQILSALLMVGVISGCATQSTRGAVGEDVSKGAYEDAFRRAEYSIVHGNDETADYIRLFKEQYPESLPAIAAYYRKLFEQSVSKLEILSEPENMAAVHKAGLLSDADYQTLTQLLGEVVERRMADGSLSLVLTDNYQSIPRLTTPANEELIFRNSVDKLISTGSKPLAKAVFKAALDKGSESPQYRYLADRVMQIRLSKKMLEGDFKALFPEEAQARIQRTQVKLKLVAPSKDDEDFVYDIGEYLEKKDQVELVDEAGPDTYVITLHKRRFKERELPDRTQTVRYSQSEVNLLSAALLMPQNATYLYDVSTGGFSISYAFDVKLTQADKTLEDKKIKGKREEKYSYCSEARIRNVFGGVSSAGFVANPDMQSRCSKNTRSVDEDAVYGEVMAGIAAQILSFPPISNRLNYGML